MTYHLISCHIMVYFSFGKIPPSPHPPILPSFHPDLQRHHRLRHRLLQQLQAPQPPPAVPQRLEELPRPLRRALRLQGTGLRAGLRLRQAAGGDGKQRHGLALLDVDGWGGDG